ncbi:MAG: CAF17-like 4Fe-4S cluster assembly/insertion protein YgfZ [Actinomycetota bacterium]
MNAFQAHVPRDLVIVAGPDATTFLQSLVSQDLDALAVGASAPSLLLQPQGKLLVAFRALHVAADEWWLVCEPGFGQVLAEGLSRFKIRVNADIHTRAVDVLAVRGDVARPDPAPGVFVDVVDERGWNGFDLVATADAGLDLPTLDAADFERERIVAGVPRQGVDIDETTIPQEAGLERDSVSFTKGCFVGQELVCRIDTRGHVNRSLRRLRADAPLAVGADVSFADKVVGRVTSSAGTVALALVRREIEPPAVVMVGATEASVEAV